MKLSADLIGLDPLMRRLAKLGETIAAPAVEAATDALAHELERAREVAGLTEPLMQDGNARRHRIGASDIPSVARELGSLLEPPAPWLAPALPAARRPMRAAVNAAAARALSGLSPRVRRSTQ